METFACFPLSTGPFPLKRVRLYQYKKKSSTLLLDLIKFGETVCVCVCACVLCPYISIFQGHFFFFVVGSTAEFWETEVFVFQKERERERERDFKNSAGCRDERGILPFSHPLLEARDAVSSAGISRREERDGI